MPKVAGIDVGSAFTKAVVVSDAAGAAAVVGRGAVRTGVDLEKAAADSLAHGAGRCRIATRIGGLHRHHGIRPVQRQLPRPAGDRDHQRCARSTFLFPQATAVLDIGSQCTRAITLTENGKVRGFKTNDKCAAGSGSFIVRAAKYLQIELGEVGEIALHAENPQPISSICAVLAESEIINHVSAGVSVEDILSASTIHSPSAPRCC